MSERKKEKTPVLLSALVYPGAGQLLQKRWISAAIFLTLFTIFMCILLINVMRPLIKNITTAMDWAATQANEEFVPISIPGIIIPFLLSLAVYVTNIIDVVMASRQPPPTPPPIPPI